MHQLHQLAPQSVLGQGLGEPPRQIHRAGEVSTMTLLAGQHSQRDRQMCFTDAWRPQKDKVSALVEEPQGSKLLDKAHVKARLRRIVEVAQPLLAGESGKLEAQFNGSFMTLLHLRRQQIAQEVAVAPLLGGGALTRGVQTFPGDTQPQRRQMRSSLLLEWNAHCAAHSSGIRSMSS